MVITPTPTTRPQLKVMVREARFALAMLDLKRLEELAASCEALTRTYIDAAEARDAAGEIGVLARVLEATRANAELMGRLRSMSVRKVEYTEREVCGEVERRYGHD